MKSIKYIGIAGALSLTVLLSGCSGSEQTSEQSQTSAAPEVTTKPQSAAPQTTSAESSATESTVPESTAPDPEQETAEFSSDNSGTPEKEPPEASGGYSADWLYGTWSTLTLNGADYWDFADERGIDGEVQLVFDSEGCDVIRGSEGVVFELQYIVTDSGAEIWENESGDKAVLTYNAAEDTLSVDDGENNFVCIRGSNPRKNGAQNSAGEGLYGLWSTVTVNGEDFWTSDRFMQAQTGECLVEINESGFRAINNYECRGYFPLRPTDNGAEFTDPRDGLDYVLSYDAASDAVICYQKSQPEGDTMTLKRGTNPKDGAVRASEWLYGTWSAVTVNGEDFWSCADAKNYSNEAQLVFTPDYCYASEEDGSFAKKYSFTADGTGAAIHVTDSYNVTCMYNSVTDRIMVKDEQSQQTIVMKRGTNPRT